MTDTEDVRYQVRVQHRTSIVITPGGEQFFIWGNEPRHAVEVSETSESWRKVEFMVDGESFRFRTPHTDEYGSLDDPRIDESMYTQQETSITEDIDRQRQYTKSMTRFLGGTAAFGLAIEGGAWANMGFQNSYADMAMAGMITVFGAFCGRHIHAERRNGQKRLTALDRRTAALKKLSGFVRRSPVIQES